MAVPLPTAHCTRLTRLVGDFEKIELHQVIEGRQVVRAFLKRPLEHVVLVPVAGCRHTRQVPALVQVLQDLHSEVLLQRGVPFGTTFI